MLQYGSLPHQTVLSNGRTITFQELEKEDYYRGFLDLINCLSSPKTRVEITYEDFATHFDLICESTRIFVAVYRDTIIGTVSVRIERKFLHNLSAVGHIEDLVIHPEFRHQTIGRSLIQLCLDYCFRGITKEKCYKVILNCTEANVEFYEKCGFRRNETQMRIDAEQWSTR
mmetsp:Transcript_19596/g.30702  ORF Transcript_19596/g.30702 Transcript_19596/m.30702 type:complete len:171 (-) Transcript_19596:6-518(-)